MKKIIESFKLGVGGQVFSQLLRRKPELPQMPELGKEIFLPGQNGETHNGFVNCQNNATGLKARFFDLADKKVGLLWEHSHRAFEGYPGIIHGGITSSLLDELMTNAVFHRCHHFGVTTKATIKWAKPLRTGEIATGFGEVTYSTKEFARVRAFLFREDKQLIASGDGLFYFPTLSQFKRMTQTKTVDPSVVAHFRGRATPS